jgi:cell division protein FtsW (lipid II flippase)
MKIVIIVTFARFFNNFHAVGGLSVKDMLFPLGLLAVPALLIMKQPDLGTATLVVLIAVSMAFYIGIPLVHHCDLCPGDGALFLVHLGRLHETVSEKPRA